MQVSAKGEERGQCIEELKTASGIFLFPIHNTLMPSLWQIVFEIISSCGQIDSHAAAEDTPLLVEHN